MAKELVANAGHEYAPILGLKAFCDEAVKLAFHSTKVFSDERVGFFFEQHENMLKISKLLLVNSCLELGH